MRKRHSQSGFTLVELSIVLVVVGLIIGSILVALSIIQNARVTSAINTLQSIQSAISTYNQNYGAMPGDDPNATTRFSDPNNLVSNDGNGDGEIGNGESFDTPGEAANATDPYESMLVWKELRAAGLIKGEAVADTLPPNPFNGVFGVQNGAFGQDSSAGSLAGNVICMSGVPGQAARIIDQRLDDGNATSGAVRGAANIGSAPTDYSEGTNVVICSRV